MMKRKRRFEKCILTFPDREEFYRTEIARLDEGLRKIKACLLCGRPLKGEESQRNGYGPECLKRIEANAEGGNEET